MGDMEKQHKAGNSEFFYSRQMEIEDFLYKKMQSVPYGNISITDLCKGLGISRRSFYHYYVDKDACLRGFVDRVIGIYISNLVSLSPSVSVEEKVFTMLNMWKSEDTKRFLDVFVKNNLMGVIVERVLHFVREEEKQFFIPFVAEYGALDEDMICAHIGADMALLLRWYGRGFDTPIELMVQKYVNLKKI